MHKLALAILVVLGLSAPARADASSLDIDALYESIATDLKAGSPLVVQVHVPLCESDILVCGNAKLGDGDNPDTNLYWSTSGGFKGWFRSAPGWKLLHSEKPSSGEVLEKRVWRRRITPTKAWRARGVNKAFSVYVVAYAWRGHSIGMAIDSYVSQLAGKQPQELTLEDGTKLEVGGAAQVVAYVGHNGWMDIDFDWSKRPHGGSAKGSIAIACMTADYLAEPMQDEHIAPLLMTTSLMFAGAHSFEGAVSALAQGQSLKELRRAAAQNHAKGQGRPFARVLGAFTNPSDGRWRRYVQARP